MAQPIPLELPKRDPREELRSRLERAPADHAAALLAGYEVLQGLHDQGVLDLLRGLLAGGDKILESVVDATKTPEAIRGIRNLLVISKVFGSIDPALLEKFAGAMPGALEGAAKAQQAEPPGIGGILKILSGKNLRRGLAVVNGLLEGWGKSFSTASGR
jgi:uncharacterized protein YjgD (DUF1641 family)